jgi:hypothetical protein
VLNRFGLVRLWLQIFAWSKSEENKLETARGKKNLASVNTGCHPKKMRTTKPLRWVFKKLKGRELKQILTPGSHANIDLFNHKENLIWKMVP